MIRSVALALITAVSAGTAPARRGVAGGARSPPGRARGCHDLGGAPPAALRSPRAVNGRVESLGRFLGGPPPGLSPLGWDGQPTADLIAFLISSVGGGPASGSP